MKTRLSMLLVVAALMVAALAPALAGQASAAAPRSTHPAILDKTRFALHMGAAYFAFHHFVWARYKNGGFAAGAKGRKTNFVKAGVALLFAAHEVKVAYGIANTSKSKSLHALAGQVNALGASFGSIGSRFHSGQGSVSDVTSLNGSATSLQSQAGSAGFGFQDRSVPVPGAA